MKNIKVVIFTLISLLLIVNGCKKGEDPTIEAPSELSYSADTLSLIYGTAGTSSVATVTGDMPIEYSISTSPTSSAINIDILTGLITATDSVEVGTYEITITATNPEGTTTATYTIVIGSPQDYPTTLLYSPTSSTMVFGDSAISAIPSVDGTAPIYFSMEVSPTTNAITIDSVNGELTIDKSITTGTFVITVTATNLYGTATTTYNVQVDANPSLLSFATDISPIIQGNCSSCHTYGGSQTNYIDYTNASNRVNMLVDRTNRTQGGLGFMPKNGTKLTQPQLDLIQQWWDEGLQP
jgi:hypothetical protein